MAMKEALKDAKWYDVEGGSFGHVSEFEGDKIQDARAWLHGRFRAGEISECPCCGQVVKLYARILTDEMIAVLDKLKRRGPLTPDEIDTRGGDYAKMRHWGFIKKDGQYWRITDVGVLFLKGELRVPKWQLVYNGTVMGASIAHIDVTDVVGHSFSYDELMAPETVRAATAGL